MEKQIAKRTYVPNYAAFITRLLTLKDNYYANYLTGIWISSFDPCTSIFPLCGDETLSFLLKNFSCENMF